MIITADTMRICRYAMIINIAIANTVIDLARFKYLWV